MANENKTKMPTISNYGKYSSGNYGAHTLMVDIGVLRLWFSYKTIVAFSTHDKKVVSENEWGTTTGKHLTWIDGGDKKNRMPRKQFEHELTKVMTEHNLTL